MKILYIFLIGLLTIGPTAIISYRLYSDIIQNPSHISRFIDNKDIIYIEQIFDSLLHSSYQYGYKFLSLSMRVYQNIIETKSENVLSPEEEKELAILKTRSNFASINGGAKILGSNPGCISPKSILDDNKDSYMINECDQQDKWVIIALSEDILMDTLSLINLEYYSSGIEEFEIWISTNYPSEEWLKIGTFNAKNHHKWQFFKIKPTWTRYVKLIFKTHYSGEFYCTLTQIRVFGVTMLEGFRRDFNSTTLEDLSEEETSYIYHTTTTTKHISSSSTSTSSNISPPPPPPPSLTSFYKFDDEYQTNDFFEYIFNRTIDICMNSTSASFEYEVTSVSSSPITTISNPFQLTSIQNNEQNQTHEIQQAHHQHSTIHNQTITNQTENFLFFCSHQSVNQGFTEAPISSPVSSESSASSLVTTAEGTTRAPILINRYNFKGGESIPNTTIGFSYTKHIEKKQKSYPYESIFRTLSRRIKVLEANQKYYEELLEKYSQREEYLIHELETLKNLYAKVKLKQNIDKIELNNLQKKLEQNMENHQTLNQNFLNFHNKIQNALDTIWKFRWIIGGIIGGITMFYLLTKTSQLGVKNQKADLTPKNKNLTPKRAKNSKSDGRFTKHINKLKETLTPITKSVRSIDQDDYDIKSVKSAMKYDEIPIRKPKNHKKKN